MNRKSDPASLPLIPDAAGVRRRQSELARIFDPFGITTALVEAQRAWLQHPQELSAALTRLAWDYSTLQLHAIQRSLGLRGEEPLKAVAQDERFTDPAWSGYPAFSELKQTYLLISRWLEDSLYRTPDLPGRQKRRAAFWARQWLNALAPGNFLLTNPVAIQKFLESGGQSVVDGLRNWVSDLRVGDVQMVDRSEFRVGGNLATTPGAVVLRNPLLEVIHYAPATDQVREIPIVIIAPWINKYYILDINERKSLVRHLVNQGFSVFITSWKNPGPDLAQTRFDDYLTEGVLKAIETAREVSGSSRVHAVGYCLGGTALAAMMAWFNRKYPDPDQVPVAHWSLFTTLVDFSRPGGIEVFVDEQSVEFLEDLMAGQGYLDGREMARAFRLLRSNSLIWHYVVHGYLYGETPPAFDVLYWNTDVTRLPAAMHGFYLREFYLHNNLVKKDGVALAGQPIDLGLIRQPLYCVGCEEDHIAPWKAAFDICARVGGPVQFTLSSSGHILGIVSPPVDPPRRMYWTGEAQGQANTEKWLLQQDKRPGSWWEHWVPWLHRRCGKLVAPPPLATRKHPKLAPAPGTYVLEP